MYSLKKYLISWYNYTGLGTNITSMLMMCRSEEKRLGIIKTQYYFDKILVFPNI